MRCCGSGAAASSYPSYRVGKAGPDEGQICALGAFSDHVENVSRINVRIRLKGSPKAGNKVTVLQAGRHVKT
jgi:hypothetical protein